MDDQLTFFIMPCVRTCCQHLYFQRCKENPILIYQLICTHYLHWSIKCNYQNISFGLQTKWNMASTLQSDLQSRNTCLHVFDSFGGWSQVVLLVKVEPGSACNPAFRFAGPLGVGTPTSLIDCLRLKEWEHCLFLCRKKKKLRLVCTQMTEKATVMAATD